MSSIRFVSKDLSEAEEKAISEKKAKEEYDPRTLYERLQEQKQKKEDEFTEATKFSNLIKRIDEDEFEYLKTIEDSRDQDERHKRRMEEEELDKFRRAVEETRNSNIPATSPPLKESATLVSTQTTIKPVGSVVGKKDVMKSILAGAIVRKRSKDSSENGHAEKKAKVDNVIVKEKLASTSDNSKSTKSLQVPPVALSSLVAYSDGDEDDNESSEEEN